jgi:hypothetical protein
MLASCWSLLKARVNLATYAVYHHFLLAYNEKLADRLGGGSPNYLGKTEWWLIQSLPRIFMTGFPWYQSSGARCAGLTSMRLVTRRVVPLDGFSHN